jgi:iron complex outermembrane recepter protein
MQRGAAPGTREDDLAQSKDLRRSLLGAAAVTLWMAGAPGSAGAETPASGKPIQLSIEAAPLGDALRAFSIQTGVPVLFSEQQVAGLRAGAVTGRHAPDEALARLLSGSGLEASRSAGGAYVVRAAPVRPAGTAAPEPVAPARPQRVPEVLRMRTLALMCQNRGNGRSS